MSFYSDSSLVVIPSGYKTSKVYSAVPTDGTGDLTFTRSNDTATRVASNGLIEKVRTNLALQSQTFDNASWTKDASSITANTIAAPDGTLTAETLTADGTSASHGIRQTGTATLTNGIVYSTSIYAKKGTNNFIQIVGSTAPYVTFNVFANFDLNNGVVGTVGSSVTATIQDAGNGWYRCTMIAAAAATSSTNSFIVQIVSSASAARGESNSLATSVFLWGAQLETSDFGPTPYIPTVAAAVSVGPVANIPRIDYLGGGCGKLLLEPQRTNLVFYSEQFNNAYWGKLNVTVDSNVTTSPDGYTNADRLKDDAVSGSHYAASSAITVTNATQYTFTAYLKADTLTWVRLELFSGGCFFNLSNGTLGTASGATATITSVGNGWYRCSVMATSASTTAYPAIRLTTGNGVFGYAGNGSGLFVWGAQLEAGSFATSYIPTLAASVTRGVDSAILNNSAALPTAYPFTFFAEINYDRAIESQYPICLIDSSTSDTYINLGIGFTSNYEPSVTVRSPSTSVTVPSNSTLTAGRHKLAIVVTSTNIKIFSDGVLRNTGSNSIAFNAGMNDLLIGQLRTVADTGTRQKLTSQALVFKSALSDADAIALTTL